MDAVLLAGGIPQPDEPLYAYSGGEAKALIDVAGKPMVQWVLDALGDAKSIDRIVVIGLSNKSNLPCKKPLIYLSNQGKLLDNLKAGTAKVLELNPHAEFVLFVSSDIPALTGEMVDWLVQTCKETDDDLYYNVIRREDMEKRYPGSRRTYTRLKDMEVCGGDMNMARASIVNENSTFWTKVLDARKSPISQAALLGPGIIFKFIFRQLTADDVIRHVANRLDLRGRAIVCPYPEVGMDVDKPHQLEIMRHDLEKRRVERAAPRAAKKPSTGSRKRASRSASKPATKSRSRPARKTGSRAKS
ncbi:MAG TPA: nucleotidyltransferase family protein [Anaerolineales bacterium]